MADLFSLAAGNKEASGTAKAKLVTFAAAISV